MRLALQEKTSERQRIDANVQQGSARKFGIEEAILHVKLFVAAKILLNQVDWTKLASLHTANQLFVEWHVQNGAGIHELNAILTSKFFGLKQLSGIERNGLLAQHMLARLKRFAQVDDVCVVRRGQIHRVNLVAGEKIVDAVIHTLDVVFLCKRDGLFLRSVGYAVNGSANRSQRLCHLICNDSAANNTPPEVWCGKDRVHGACGILRGARDVLCGARGVL